ncbi:MAG: SDR family NAD(P)-dependent oxidoreductase [Anaerolineaceae bacterium]|nr:SDR family NAD(P)-dependent oxidoreductase [Anaerolineaceae bacterium]
MVTMDVANKTIIKKSIINKKDIGQITHKKVLVTGATGFLGSHLTENLVLNGYKVRALVYERDYLSNRLGNSVEKVRGDITDPDSIESAMHDIDVVFHCAAVTQNNISWKIHFDTNIKGTENVLNAALKNKVSKLVHISSVIVYGYSLSHINNIFVEDSPYSSELEPMAYYMCSKLQSEKLVFKYFHNFGLPITVMRLGILYGSRHDRSVNRGLAQIGKMRFIIGTGYNHLPYTYITNAVDCLVKASIISNSIGQAFNVVDSPPITVREFMTKNMVITGNRYKLISVPSKILYSLANIMEKHNSMMSNPIPPRLSRYTINRATRDIIYDTTKAKNQLGWEPVVSFDEGLKKTFDI